MADKPQSFESHTRLVPAFHGFVLPMLAANFFNAVLLLYRSPSFGTGLAVLVALALITLAVYTRNFALRVQDRVIRLEMRLRLHQALPAELQSRIPEFTVGQLVALRFASDEELPALAATVLRDNIQDKKTIKKLVKNWQADHQRA